LLRDNHFGTREQARHAVAAWIEDYNSARRHSTDNMLSPIAYEHACAQRHSADDGHDPRAA
jgi:putative transposase